MTALPPRALFQHCPRCAKALPAGSDPRMECGHCGWVYYVNPTVSASVFAAREDGRVLLLRRSSEPAKGRWAPPGGFIDFDETAEAAAAREAREETALAIDGLRFLGSWTNRYVYRGVEYRVLDLFFTARALNPTDAAPSEEAEDVSWVLPRDADPESMAFPSTAAALRRLQEGQ
ncbi:MAG: NUDIX hydrolase [Verrucomicrobiota bacterium]|jgi:ADP-ribose pyrophosphatase YjhB (NUDIX family)